jgi:hypothetical protein
MIEKCTHEIHVEKISLKHSRMSRRIFANRRKEIGGGHKKLLKMERNNLYSS